MFNKIASLIRSFLIRLFYTDKMYANWMIKKNLKRKLNLSNPHYYFDKLQWLKLYWRDPLATKCADKVLVRDYVRNKIDGEILIPLVGIYTEFDEIDFNLLPNQFIIKTNNGSGNNVICWDKNKLDWKDTKKRVKRNLSKKFYLKEREWVYKDIKPKIIIEELLTNEDEIPCDYKFFCFHGEPKMIQLNIDRFGDHVENFYNEYWELIDKKFSMNNDKKRYRTEPENFNLMKSIAHQLSADFPHCRVDLYNIKGKIFFGEITFFPHGGATKVIDEDFELMLGSYLDLKKVKSIEEEGNI